MLISGLLKAFLQPPFFVMISLWFAYTTAVRLACFSLKFLITSWSSCIVLPELFVAGLEYEFLETHYSLSYLSIESDIKIMLKILKMGLIAVLIILKS